MDKRRWCRGKLVARQHRGMGEGEWEHTLQEVREGGGGGNRCAHRSTEAWRHGHDVWGGVGSGIVVGASRWWWREGDCGQHTSTWLGGALQGQWGDMLHGRSCHRQGRCPVAACSVLVVE